MQPVVDGLNVRQVAYADGIFQQITDNSWIERHDNGHYLFREVGRSETTVSLIKEDGARIFLDLRRNKIRYNRRDLYDITEVSDFSEFMLVTGWSVRQVGYRGGIFQQLDDGSWIEKNENGEYTFRELSRDEDSVYLLKEDGDRIRLDLHRGKIIANGRFELYDITSLSSILGRG
jgi:predicted transcriptional regulator of viral defense system